MGLVVAKAKPKETNGKQPTFFFSGGVLREDNTVLLVSGLPGAESSLEFKWILELL